MVKARSLLLDMYERFLCSVYQRSLANLNQDCEAYRLRGNEQGWQIVGSMESKGRPGLGAQREESALNMFRQMDLKGKVKDDTQLNTVHQNTITTIRVYDEAGGAVQKFSSKSSNLVSSFRLCLIC